MLHIQLQMCYIYNCKCAINRIANVLQIQLESWYKYNIYVYQLMQSLFSIKSWEGLKTNIVYYKYNYKCATNIIANVLQIQLQIWYKYNTTAFQYNHSFGFQKPMKVKVVEWGWKKWNEHDLMHIYHQQCEIIQKIEWNNSNGQIHCFHYVR